MDAPSQQSKEALLAAEDKIKKLEAQLLNCKNAEQEIDELRSETEKLRRAKSADQRQIDKLIADVEGLKSDLNQTRKREKRLGDEKRELEKELVGLQEKIHARELDIEDAVVEGETSKFRIELYYCESTIPGRIEHIGSKAVSKFQLDEPGEILRFLAQYSPVAPANAEESAGMEIKKTAAQDERPPVLPTAEPVDADESEMQPKVRVNLTRIANTRRLYADQSFKIELQLEADYEIKKQCEKGVREETSVFARSLGSKRKKQLIGMKSEDNPLENPIVVNIPAAVLEPGLYRIDTKIDLTPDMTGETLHASKDCGLIYMF